MNEDGSNGIADFGWGDAFLKLMPYRLDDGDLSVVMRVRYARTAELAI
jgi:hypothetical protein